MHIAFYKARCGNLTDKLTNLFSGRFGYSHVELVFSDGISFSSSPRDGGVRFKDITFKPDHWEMLYLPIGPNTEDSIRASANKFVGQKYDWRGIFGLVFLTGENKHKQFCSEVIVRVLQSRNLMCHVPPHLVSPNTLILIIKSELKNSFTGMFNK